MIIKKITTGFVIQTFDTKKHAYTGQCFVAGDQVDYEGELGNPLSHEEMAKYKFGPSCEEEPYLPFDMLQPAEIPFTGKQLGK
jgi:hypothetical protein